MKATNHRFGGLPVHIDDKLCVVPKYTVSAGLHRTSPDLADELQAWCNQFFGTKHQAFTMNTGLFRPGGPINSINDLKRQDEILVVSTQLYQTLLREMELILPGDPVWTPSGK